MEKTGKRKEEQPLSAKMSIFSSVRGRQMRLPPSSTRRQKNKHQDSMQHHDAQADEYADNGPHIPRDRSVRRFVLVCHESQDAAEQ